MSKSPLGSPGRHPVKQFKNVTLSHSSCNLEMLPVAAGAVGMWKSGAWFLAGFPRAEGSVGNSPLLLEFSTLSSARHFHSASSAVVSPTRTRPPTILRLPASGWDDGGRVGDSADRRVFLGALRHRGGGGLAAESEDPPALGLHRGRELKRIQTLAQALQLRYLHWIGRPTKPPALQRGLRCWVTPPQAGAYPLFVGQFHRGQEEILK